MANYTSHDEFLVKELQKNIFQWEDYLNGGDEPYFKIHVGSGSPQEVIDYLKNEIRKCGRPEVVTPDIQKESHQRLPDYRPIDWFVI